MARFKLPPISPLAGSKFSSFFKTLYGRKIAKGNYFKLLVSLVVVLLCSIFQWIDYGYFKRRIRRIKHQTDPIFIVGHWRTGTTFLHNILAKDPQMGFVSTYQSVFANNLRSKWLFKTFMRVHIPSKRPGDNVKLGVDLPQEEEFALSNMNPYSFYQYMYLPGYFREYYEKYVRFNGISRRVQKKWDADYKLMINKAMIEGGGKIPLLKNPANTGRIKHLLSLFPNARFIHTIRNPVIVIISSKKFFMELLPTISLQSISEQELENMIFDLYDLFIHDFLAQKEFIPSQNLYEIKFDEYEKDPLLFLAEIYHKFNLPGYTSAEPNFKNYISSMSGYKKNKHVVEKEFFDRILDRCDFAMKLWGYEIPSNIEVK